MVQACLIEDKKGYWLLVYIHVLCLRLDGLNPTHTVDAKLSPPLSIYHYRHQINLAHPSHAHLTPLHSPPRPHVQPRHRQSTCLSTRVAPPEKQQHAPPSSASRPQPTALPPSLPPSLPKLHATKRTLCPVRRPPLLRSIPMAVRRTLCGGGGGEGLQRRQTMRCEEARRGMKNPSLGGVA